MTRLEQHDSYLREFDARLLETRGPGGREWRLDRSAFYPTSGGQPHDTGTVSTGSVDWRVVDVRLERGVVWHSVEPEAAAAPVPPVGVALTGRIDWQRRFRHMQRHSAQHLLSQAFVRVGAGFGTRAVSLSSPDLTLDLSGEPDDGALAEAERLTNEVAAAALAIRAFEVDESELGRYALRRPPKVRGRVRIVEMGDWERAACGGTHLRSTAEALPVLLRGRERVRGDLVRVTFRAGLEAVALASETIGAASAAAVTLSSAVADLPGRVATLVAEAAAARRALAQAQQETAGLLADTLVGRRAGADPASRVIAEALPRERAALVTPLADALAERGVSAVIAAPDGDRAQVVVASGAGVDVRPALRAALEPLEGRGGGRPERAQGAGPRVDRLEAAVAAARRVLEAAAETG
jgi:alanyl-tRNA synthetase